MLNSRIYLFFCLRINTSINTFMQGVMGRGPSEAIDPQYCIWNVLWLWWEGFPSAPTGYSAQQQTHLPWHQPPVEAGIIRSGRATAWTLATPIFERLTENTNSWEQGKSNLTITCPSHLMGAGYRSIKAENIFDSWICPFPLICYKKIQGTM